MYDRTDVINIYPTSLTPNLTPTTHRTVASAGVLAFF